MSKKITLFDCIANDIPSAMMAKKIIENHGYTVSFRDEPGFIACLKQFVKAEATKGKEKEALYSLALAHPDRELILASADISHGFDGFSNAAAEKTVAEKIVTPAPVNAGTVQQAHHKNDYTPVLIAGFLASALFLSVAIISKK